METGQARRWETGLPVIDLVEWFKALLLDWNTRFASWRSDGDDDDLTCAADPQVVAVMEYIASLIPDEPEEVKD